MAEFELLHDEIVSRRHIIAALTVAYVTALGTALAALAVWSKYPYVTLGAAAISSCLWIALGAEQRQIAILGAYFKCELIPRVRSREGVNSLLGWEDFLSSQPPHWNRAWQPILYALLPAALLLYFSVSQHIFKSPVGWARLAAVAATIGLYVLAGVIAYRSWRYTRDLDKRGCE